MKTVQDKAFATFVEVMGKDRPPGTLLPSRETASPRFLEAFDAMLVIALAGAKQEDGDAAKVTAVEVESTIAEAKARRDG